MSEKDASSSLQGELLEQVCVNLVDRIVSIRNHDILAMYIAEYCLDELLEFFESKVFLLAQDIPNEVLEWYYSYQRLHEYVHTL